MVSTVTSAVWSHMCFRPGFFVSIYEQKRLFPGGVLMASPIYFRFLQVHWFCPGTHKHRVNVGWKLEVLAGEEGVAET